VSAKKKRRAPTRSKDSEGPRLSADDALLLIESLLTKRRAAIKKRTTISWAVLDRGLGCVLDTGADPMLSPGWSDDTDLAVVSNSATLSDLVLGRFDPAEPSPEHLFLFSGPDESWRAISRALTGGKSAFSAHLDSLRR
jgi:hypothetical protein